MIKLAVIKSSEHKINIKYLYRQLQRKVAYKVL